MSARQLSMLGLVALVLLIPVVAAEPESSSPLAELGSPAELCPLLEVRQPLPGHVEPQVMPDPYGCWQRRVKAVTNEVIRTVNELIGG